ncbi:MAG: hypothetical protein HY903_13520 [Deltaproteobacteria bacterium]|nr:hypothetical protein [Deltaproteobacteria bacterium]
MFRPIAVGGIAWVSVVFAISCQGKIIYDQPAAGDGAGTTCGNGVLDGNEAGVDCGGDCTACAMGSGCSADRDCVSGVCTGNTCRGSSCSNGLQDGDETGIDCGGSCGGCGATGCVLPSDCASGVCGIGNSCANPPCQCQAPTCADGVQNGDETDVDCGGACVQVANGAKTCPAGATCDGPGDCASGVCAAPGLCALPTCSDQVKNGSETGVDCGGSCSAEGKTCADGTPCGTGADCQSGICDGICVPPHCANGTPDGGETDQDCGGPDCAACGDGLSCALPRDCDSGVCGAGNSCASPPCQCQTPTCADGVKNGDETGDDCGGACVQAANGTKTCPPGVACGVDADCTGGLCAGTCQPTCSDGVLNQDERGVDCGGLCALFANGSLTCAPGTPCDVPADCTSGFCNGTCQVSSCVPPDGIKNGAETDVDCGGLDCLGCQPSQGCLLDADCAVGFCNTGKVCQTAACGDGVRAPSEACDDNSTLYPTFTDDQLAGRTCVNFAFAGGDLVCAPDCTFDLSHCSGGCGNGLVDGSEDCDGASLNGASCGGLGYTAGPGLACTADCSFDVSGCTSTACPTCPTDAYCSAGTGFLCRCPIYQTACGATCTSLLTDPANCGSCGHVCGAGVACAAGVCLSSCPTPLVKCGSRCIDPQTDSTYCGASGDCGTAVNGSDCVADFDPDRICLSGACVDAAGGEDFTGAGDAPTRCVGGGPVLNINIGCDPLDPNDPDCVVPSAVDCTGDLAAVTFRYALCSCTDIGTSHPLFADGFDSATGPYDPHCEDGTPCTIPAGASTQCTSDANADGYMTCADQKGAGVGANGDFSDSQLVTVWGTMWLSSGSANYADQSLPRTTIEQDLHVGGDLGGGPIRLRGNAYVAGDITATGTCDGTLYQSAGTVSPNLAAGAVNRTADPLTVGEACDCAPAKLIDVVGIVQAHATNNNNADITLASTLMSGLSNDVRLDLPCGMYYLTEITASNNTTVSIIVHGRAAIFVGGNIDVPKILNITLTDSAELDVFVAGTVSNNGTVYTGSPLYPSRVRFYVGGNNLACPNGGGCSISLTKIFGAANMYAPYGRVYMPQDFTLYGSIFAGRADIVQNATFHFDTAIASANSTCEHCDDGAIDPGEECDGTALGGKTCAALGYTGGPLACSPVCRFDTRACCGDGVRGGTEQCDGADLGGLTCTDLGQSGTLSCSTGCTFQGCTGGTCGNGSLETASGEQCDPGVPPEPATDVFPAEKDTCAKVLTVAAAGSLACTSGCAIDTSGCTFCGDGVGNGSEACDGNDFDPATPGVQNTPPACSAGAGRVTCSAACALDYSGCAGCLDCRDCNNQACVSGVCGACTLDTQCCSPFVCFGGECSLF